MGLFDEPLASGDTLFRNETALDPEFVPKLLPFRELQQKRVAACIAPLLQGRNGRNCFVFGAPGIGKTAAVRWVLRDLEENTDAVAQFYINCWQKNTTFKVFTELCEQLGKRFLQNKNTEELFAVLKKDLASKPVVFVFDEIDKAEDLDFLYSILNDIFKKTIVLVTNYRAWLDALDERIKSRLLPELLEFKKYNSQEMHEILRQRTEYAFVPGCWQPDALKLVADKAFELGDVRTGLHMMRQAGLAAEQDCSRKITLEHAEKAVSLVSEFSIKSSDELDEDLKLIVGIVKENSGKKIGEIFSKYTEKGGLSAYKTFQRKIERLEKAKFVTTQKTGGGSEGNTTIVSYSKTKKLDEF